MKTTNLFIQLTLALFVIFPAFAAALEVREEVYGYLEETTRIPAERTFVMTSRPQTTEPQLPAFQTILVHFNIGSATLSTTEAGLLLSGIKLQDVSLHTPLRITGHSCELGSNHLNLLLSIQRAMTVANFLSNRGYTISSLHAEGETHPITNDRKKFSQNRRVEISIQH